MHRRGQRLPQLRTSQKAMQSFSSPGEEEGIVKNALNEKRSVRHEGALHSEIGQTSEFCGVVTARCGPHENAEWRTSHTTGPQKSRTKFVRRDSSNSPGSQVRAVHLTLKTHGEVSVRINSSHSGSSAVGHSQPFLGFGSSEGF